jgi:SAM-dependent methyltransferase
MSPLTDVPPVPLADGRALRRIDDGLLSALPADAETGAYDRHAKIYDRLIGSRLYNRAIWGALIADYRAFAVEAAQTATGPLLDAGCGTALFTDAAYRETSRPLALVDRSVGMLAQAAARVSATPAPATLVQGDVLDLPFAPGGFATVSSHAVLHVLADPWTALAALADQLAPGGDLYVSMLVTDRGGLSGPYLRVLHRRGEIGVPRSADDLAVAANDLFGDLAQVERRGSMAYLRAMAPA